MCECIDKVWLKTPINSTTQSGAVGGKDWPFYFMWDQNFKNNVSGPLKANYWKPLL